MQKTKQSKTENEKFIVKWMDTKENYLAIGLLVN